MTNSARQKKTTEMTIYTHLFCVPCQYIFNPGFESRVSTGLMQLNVIYYYLRQYHICANAKSTLYNCVIVLNTSGQIKIPTVNACRNMRTYFE